MPLNVPKNISKYNSQRPCSHKIYVTDLKLSKPEWGRQNEDDFLGVAVAGSRQGEAGSRLGVAGSRLGVVGNRLGVAGSLQGVAGSRLGVVGNRLEEAGNH
jgi:hypothetical protein